MKNNIFYYRFNDNDGKIAIGQAKFTELKAYVQDIKFDDDEFMESAKLCAAKVMLAPSMEVIDLSRESIRLYTTFEDAVNARYSITECVVNCAFLNSRGNNFKPFGLQDVWDTLDERLDLEKNKVNHYQPIGYTWNGVSARRTNASEIVFDILNNQCLPCNLLDGYYYTEKACKEDNAIKCYTL